MQSYVGVGYLALFGPCRHGTEIPSVFRLPTSGIHATCFSIC